MTASSTTPLHPTEIAYRGHTITLTHRQPTNDWLYRVEATITTTLSGALPRYEAALRRAKKDIDLLTGGR